MMRIWRFCNIRNMEWNTDYAKQIDIIPERWYNLFVSQIL